MMRYKEVLKGDCKVGWQCVREPRTYMDIRNLF